MLQIIIGNLIAFVILIVGIGTYSYLTEPKYDDSSYDDDIDDGHDCPACPSCKVTTCLTCMAKHPEWVCQHALNCPEVS